MGTLGRPGLTWNPDSDSMTFVGNESCLVRFDCYTQLEIIYEIFFRLASSEASPCYEENVDWKVVSDNYFTFLNNVLKSPVASIPR